MTKKKKIKPGPKQRYKDPCQRRSISIPNDLWSKLQTTAEINYEGNVSYLVRSIINNWAENIKNKNNEAVSWNTKTQ